jgi:ferredoxin
MKLAIDWTRCDGHGLCAAVLPERISRDDWGYPLIVSDVVGDVDIRSARRAVGLCPSLALRISTP